MLTLVLDDEEIRTTANLLDDIGGRHTSVEDDDFMRELAVYAHELPRRVRTFLCTFRLEEPAGMCLISGFPVDDTQLGPTPGHWRDRPPVSRALREEIFLVLCGALLGDPFAWATQQGGALVNDLVPVRDHADEQIATGSAQVITWHTEDAFHPFAGDYVGLMCLRNPDKVATTYAELAELDIDDETADMLFAPRFYMRPDISHLSGLSDLAITAGGVEGRLIEVSRQRILGMRNAPEPVAVMFGSAHGPYLRLDPYFMDLTRQDRDATAALGQLSSEIDAKLRTAELRPGDVCFIDNFRAVHGRESFQARFDGTDRWLKRINVTRDLRRSRAARLHPGSRTIY